MSFFEEIQHNDWASLEKKIHNKSEKDVLNALNNAGRGTLDDFMALISPAASRHLEEMAQLSQQLTLKRFGKTIQLYIPLYLSNECTNSCVYCGFSHKNETPRHTLSLKQIRKEAERIKQMGFEHLLLVTGEHPVKAGVEYLEAAITELAPLFAQLSIEVQPLEKKDYKKLHDAGLNSVYIYQETYNQSNYKKYHPAGKKSNFEHRVNTPDRIGAAGVHKTGLGVLLGLEDWRTDSLFLAKHLRYLQRNYWKTTFSVSFPRLRPFSGSYQPNYEISDKELVQLITAYRIFDENLELALSTRESAHFRDHVFPLGITTMSAGSRTEPGGYSDEVEKLEQFSVADNRCPKEVAEAIKKYNYEAVWKNWDESLHL